MSSWAARDVKCPFYKSNSPTQIVCEGIDDSTAIKLNFENKEKCKQYMWKYCNLVKNYGNCQLAWLLTKKYDIQTENQQ